MTQHRRRRREALGDFREHEDGLAFVLRRPPGAPEGSPAPEGGCEPIRIDLSRFAAKAETAEPGVTGFAHFVEPEDLPALQRVTELAAFMTTVFGLATDDPERRWAEELRDLVARLTAYRDFLEDLLGVKP